MIGLDIPAVVGPVVLSLSTSAAVGPGCFLAFDSSSSGLSVDPVAIAAWLPLLLRSVFPSG